MGILGFLFLGERLACPPAGDQDDSGTLVITDAVGILQQLFQGGPPPVGPFPDCAPIDVATVDDSRCFCAACGERRGERCRNWR